MMRRAGTPDIRSDMSYVWPITPGTGGSVGDGPILLEARSDAFKFVSKKGSFHLTKLKSSNQKTSWRCRTAFRLNMKARCSAAVGAASRKSRVPCRGVRQAGHVFAAGHCCPLFRTADVRHDARHLTCTRWAQHGKYLACCASVSALRQTRHFPGHKPLASSCLGTSSTGAASEPEVGSAGGLRGEFGSPSGIVGLTP